MRIDRRSVPLWLVRLGERAGLAARLPVATRSLASRAESTPPFFVVGSGRSGTTLLRAMLSAGGDVVIPPESYVLPRVIRRFTTYSFLPWDVLASVVISEFEAHPGFEQWDVGLQPVHQAARALPVEKQTLADLISLVYEAYAAKEHKERWGDKTPINTHFLDKVVQVFPRAQYIHMVRDPRATVASYQAAGLRDFEEAIARWEGAVAKVEQVGRHLSAGQLLEVRYEALVREPAETLAQVCDFLAIDFSDEMLAYWEVAPGLGDAASAPHMANTHKSLDASFVDKWRATLTPDQVARIESALQAPMERFGYL